MLCRSSKKQRGRLSNFYYFFDDFIGTNYDNRLWAVGGTGGSIAMLAGGVIQITSTNNNNYYIDQGNRGGFSVAGYAQCTWRFYVNSTTNSDGRVGFRSSANPTTQWINFSFTPSTSANWLCEVTNGTLVTANSGVAVVASRYYEGTIVCEPGNVRFFLDGQLVATITNSPTPCIPTDLLQLYAYITETGGSGTRIMSVDFVEAFGNREA